MVDNRRKTIFPRCSNCYIEDFGLLRDNRCKYCSNMYDLPLVFEINSSPPAQNGDNFWRGAY